jgi:hypothetical protein
MTNLIIDQNRNQRLFDDKKSIKQALVRMLVSFTLFVLIVTAFTYSNITNAEKVMITDIELYKQVYPELYEEGEFE